MTDERRRRIVVGVRRHGSCSIADLCRELGVSEATVRRDLDQLAADGAIRRVRGGASDPRVSIRPEADSQPFAEVAARGEPARRAIAERAAGLVDDGDVLIMDIGTSVAAMCPFLRDRDVTVITSSLAVVNALADAPAVDLLVLGGMLRPNYASLVGAMTEANLRQVRAGLAFLGASGIRPDGAVLDTTPSEVPVKRAALEVAAQAYLLADAEKLPGSGFLEVARLDAFAGLITDAKPARTVLDPELDVEVIVA
nr:DeoR/GlpR family DNA-binding transcription regulator [Naumannella cuiyingiana]